MTAKEQELTDLVNHMVAASVEAHKVLGTPTGSPLSLADRATEVMVELKALRATVDTRATLLSNS